ncbi:MAG: acyl carrier protein [bacterium JZ-2024 1]
MGNHASEQELINKVVSKLKEVIKEHLPDVDPDQITEHSEFEKDLNLGSLEMSTILMDIEDAFNIRIQEEEFQTLKNVGDLVRTVVKHLSAKAPS